MTCEHPKGADHETTVAAGSSSTVGHALVQEGAPIQPAHQLMLTTMVETNAIRGLILRSASYTQTTFIPAIAQSFVVGAGSTTVRAAAKTLFAETTDGWDRAVPHSLGYLPGFSGNSEAGATLASVNLVLGAYNREDDRYRLFNKITLEVLYSNSLDVSPPTLVAAHGVYATTQTELTATVADDTLIVAVVGLCDNGQDAYVTVDLQVNDSAQWRGLCPTVADRFLLQLVDAAGNVATTDWQRTTGGTINENQVLYLPIVLR